MAGTDAGVGIPSYEPDEKRHRRAIVGWAQWINQGHLANTGSVTLRASPNTTTTVTDDRVSINSVPLLTPTTANAASAIAATYISTITNGSFIITHASSASVDRTFRYALLG